MVHTSSLCRLVAIVSLILSPLAYLRAATGDYPLDLRAVANMDFQDEVAGDGKGGWSDQGPQNDLRSFDLTRTDFGGIAFRIIDPASNARRAVLTFDSPHARTGLTNANVIVPAESPAAPTSLYLLHTSCWNQEPKGTAVGHFTVTFADGSSQNFDVQSRRDIADWWGAGAVENGRVVYRKANGSDQVGVYLSRFALPGKPVRSITFTTANNAVWIVVGATLSTTTVELKAKPLVFTNGTEWKTADTSDVQVRANSALDLSSTIEPGPAGKHGHVIAQPDGHVAFADDPKQPVRFFGYNMVLTHTLGSLHGKTPEETKANIRQFVTLAKRQGYNLLRPICLDTYIMVGAQADLEPNPERLDNFEYLFAQMKQEGIYLYLDLASYGQYFKGSWVEKIEKRNMKAEMSSGNATTRDNWKQGATALLTRINPYTKTILRDDPAVICVNFYNEQELGFNKIAPAPNPEVYTKLWREWLKKRYASTAEIATAWKTPAIAKLASIDEITLPSSAYNVDVQGNDYGLFLLGLETENVAWYRGIVDAVGYKGLLSQYDCGMIYREGEARSALNAISMHLYHTHPSSMMDVGSQVGQNSAVATYGGHARNITATRQWDKPFLITEYQLCFWNQHEYEGGLLFGAYAAFQDYQALMAHENAVWLSTRDALGNFSIGRSPIGRANEFLSHQLYQRRDVAVSTHRVEVRLEPDYLRANINRSSHWLQTRLALITGFGVRFALPDRAKPAREADLLLAPAEGAAVSAGDWAVNVAETGSGGGFSLPKAVEKLRERGVLPASNKTDIDKDIFQSDTGELTLLPTQKQFRVVTPRTEGVTLPDGGSAELPSLRVESTSVASTVALTSIDNQSLPASHRLVLLYITASANTGMELSDDYVTLLKPGTYPPLLRTGKLRVNIANAVSSTLEVWALSVTGERKEKLPVTARGKTLTIEIDTAKLKDGPTPFFEIVANEAQLRQGVP